MSTRVVRPSRRASLKTSARVSGEVTASGLELQLCAPDLRLELRYLPVAGLQSFGRSLRRHPARQIELLMRNIGAHGFLFPIVVDDPERPRVVVGEARVEAARRLGLAEVPAIPASHLSEEQLRLVRLADNKLAELADWDRDALALEFKELLELDVDIDLTGTGFETTEIDLVLDGDRNGGPDPADAEVEVTGPAVSRPGDLWLLDRHRLLCGDALASTSYAHVLGGEQADFLIADPPYNVPVNGHVSGLGKTRHREFLQASGELSEAAFTEFLGTFLDQSKAACRAGALLIVAMDWRHTFELQTAARRTGLHQVNLAVWVKDCGAMGSHWRSRHELFLIFKKDGAQHTNNVQLGRFGWSRTNVWEYPGANSFRRGRAEELAMHPTPKPVALVADAIRDCTARGDLVLDPFLGSGTTLIAAERTGRRARAIELDPLYVDTAVKRWEVFTGKAAVHAESGLSFAELAARRRQESQAQEGPPAKSLSPLGPDAKVAAETCHG